MLSNPWPLGEALIVFGGACLLTDQKAFSGSAPCHPQSCKLLVALTLPNVHTMSQHGKKWQRLRKILLHLGDVFRCFDEDVC